MRLRDTLWLPLTLALALSLAGCGSGDDKPAADSDSGKTSNKTDGGGAKETHSADAGGPKKNLHPEVVLKTTAGDIKLRLDAENAPLTVTNFLEYVNNGHYDGTIFHQAVEGYIILGGGYTGEFAEKPTNPPIRNEAGDHSLKNKRGTIAMARQADVIDSSTCQFFINLSDNDNLDHKGRTVEDYGYCVFGEVVQGLDILEQLASSGVEDKEVGGELFQLAPTRTVQIEQAKHLR